MKKFQRIANSKDIKIICNGPFSDDVIRERENDYYALSDVDFKKKYRDYLFKPATMETTDGLYELQYNFCNNTFCKWYGKQQLRYEDVKNKPSRYKLNGNKGSDVPAIECNEIPEDKTFGIVQGNATLTISNWSLAEEIKRLIEINTVIPVEPDYVFHKNNCSNHDKTPFIDVNFFYRKGKSNTNSMRYQCKECKKCTNVLPEQDECFNYHQKRNDILVQFAMDIVSRTPVKRTCEKLGIGSATYYNKLQWLYRKCLEFNARHEKEAFNNMAFNEMWLNTDMMEYNLNNIKLKGNGKKRNITTKENASLRNCECRFEIRLCIPNRCSI